MLKDTAQEEKLETWTSAHVEVVDDVIPRTTFTLRPEERADVIAKAKAMLAERDIEANDGALAIAIDGCLHDNGHLVKAKALVQELIPMWEEVRPKEGLDISGLGGIDVYFEKAARVLHIYDEAMKEFKLSGFSSSMRPTFDDQMVRFRKLIGKVRTSAKTMQASMIRDERIAQHQADRQPDVEMTGTMCKECGKKQARVDGLCKRCAHAAGVMPHGKIT